MGGNITIRKAEGKWVVRAGGAVLGESSEALELSEGDLPSVIYFPRSDIAMAFLDRSETAITSPGKGAATRFTIETKSGPLKDAAWSYEDPIDGMERIRDYLAFNTGDRITVERL